jgi:pimeloyl-ACP methyl ester carboxylesterase
MLDSTYVRANGLRFHVLGEGQGDRLALCLHGFPELGYSYRHQLPMLARLGYRAWAPDMRGYGKSSRPARVSEYTIEHQIDDIAALIEAAGVRRATIIAHDLGGLNAWMFAMRRPEMVERLVMLNMPHPAPLARELLRLRQLRRFWYVALFQIPGLAERSLAADGYRQIDNAFLSTACNPDRFREEDLRVFREAAAEPGALSSMLAYYRANTWRLLSQLRAGFPIIEAPTLMIWGEHDMALDKSTTIGTNEHVRDLTLRYLPTASHWVQQDEPEIVNAMIEAWLTDQRVPQAWEISASGERS